MPVSYAFNPVQFDTLIYSTYYAPRGRMRLYMLAGALAHRYIQPTDLLVGIIGSEGAGKSTLREKKISIWRFSQTPGLAIQ